MYRDEFEKYLQEEKRTSGNTLRAYTRDVTRFDIFLRERGISDDINASNADIVAYLIELKNSGASKSTVNRKLSSIRIYYDFLVRKALLKENPADNIRSPKIEKKSMDFLSPDEINRLMASPDGSVKGLRDRALLELMYATGIRSAEVTDLRMADLNLKMGFITCRGDRARARIIPIGRMARQALDEYLKRARDQFTRGREQPYIFVNARGEKLTRQGLWKILKEYGEKLQLGVSLTPQVIRNSFAIHMLQNGADLRSLQELMGHEDISATQSYLAFTKTHIKDVYDRSHPRA